MIKIIKKEKLLLYKNELYKNYALYPSSIIILICLESHKYNKIVHIDFKARYWFFTFLYY